jgi:hypothetical protein
MSSNIKSVVKELNELNEIRAKRTIKRIEFLGHVITGLIVFAPGFLMTAGLILSNMILQYELKTAVSVSAMALAMAIGITFQVPMLVGLLVGNFSNLSKKISWGIVNKINENRRYKELSKKEKELRAALAIYEIEQMNEEEFRGLKA